MNYFNSPEFVESELYQKFMAENPGMGKLKIRAYAASEALPVSGLRVIVSATLDSMKIIFFDGYTDASGMIENLSLPAPLLEVNNMVAPKSMVYTIDAISADSSEKLFEIHIYDGICVVQNINFVPGGIYGN